MQVGILNSNSEQHAKGLRLPYCAEGTAHPGTRGQTGAGSEGPSEDRQMVAMGQGFEGVHLLPPAWLGDSPLPGAGGTFKMPGSRPGISWDLAFCLPGPPTWHATSCSLAKAWPSPGTASVPGMIWDKDNHVRLSSRGTRHPLACMDRNPGRQRGGGVPRCPPGAQAAEGTGAEDPTACGPGLHLQPPCQPSLPQSLSHAQENGSRTFIPLG